MPRLEFWFELASNYAYLSAMRIEARAKAAGVNLVWRPFLLGPIFRAQGWETSPFNLYPAKGRYMIRDMERLTAARGLVFHMPSPFPANTLQAARVATVGSAAPWLPQFVQAAYLAQFADGRDIADELTLRDILDALSLDSRDIISRAATAETKAALRASTEEAMRHGIFGAPSFRTEDGELFWGDDRLDDALEWCKFSTRS